MEQDITITTKGEYNNIDLKDLDEGNHIIIEKTFDVPRELPSKFEGGKPFYSCGANYKDKQVSFFLNYNHIDAYNALGGTGTRLKVTLYKETFTNPKTNVEMLLKKFKFEKVE